MLRTTVILGRTLPNMVPHSPRVTGPLTCEIWLVVNFLSLELSITPLLNFRDFMGEDPVTQT